MLDGVVDQYREHILLPGKQPLFLLLVGFILSFLGIRMSVRMIRRGVSWWPGNIKPGGLHIHHMVFGAGFLLVAGVAEFSPAGESPGWRSFFAFVFGLGCGLVLDEFALILHLEDVYWSEQGRKSVDAVIIGILLVAILLVFGAPVGARPPGGGRVALLGVLTGTLVLAVVTLLKGKTWTGLLGLMVPVLALVGAVRLARPGSPWARWRYAPRPKRAARARRREDRLHRRIDRARFWLFDLIAGAPESAGAVVLQKSPMLQKATDRLAQAVAGYEGSGEPAGVGPVTEVAGPVPPDRPVVLGAGTHHLSDLELRQLLELRRRIASARRAARGRGAAAVTDRPGRVLMERLERLRVELREEHEESLRHYEQRRVARRQARSNRRRR